ELGLDEYFLRWRHVAQRSERATSCGRSGAARRREWPVELEHGPGGCEPLVPQSCGSHVDVGIAIFHWRKIAGLLGAIRSFSVARAGAAVHDRRLGGSTVRA